MCQFFSALIVDKNREALWHPDKDSHTDLIEHFKLKDETQSPNFVCVEFTPPNGDVFNHDFSKWIFKTDQDFKPDWYDEEKAQKTILLATQKLIDERFVLNDKKWKKLEGGRFWVKNSSVVARGNSSVVAWENSSVVAWENSQTIIPYSEKVIIKAVYDLASIKDIPNKKIIIASNNLVLESFQVKS